jgi:hypothetical protein
MKSMLALVPLALVAFIAAQDMPKEEKQDQPDPKKLPPSQKAPAQVYQPLSKEEEERLQKAKEKFYVKPVDEPKLPTIEEAKTKGVRELLGGGYLHTTEKDGVKTHRAVVPATIGITSGMIEVFATLGPKDHEAVLRIYCDIHVLDLTLSSIMRIKRGDYPEKYGEADRSDDSRILAFVQWRDKDGKAVTHRAEDLVIDVKRDRAFPRVGWMYLGAWHESEHPVTKKPQKTLRAALSKLAITTFRDPYSLIDNTLKKEDSEDDIYAANMFVLPDPGTNVLVFFRKPAPDEMKAIKKVEAEIYPPEKKDK